MFNQRDHVGNVSLNNVAQCLGYIELLKSISLLMTYINQHETAGERNCLTASLIFFNNFVLKNDKVNKLLVRCPRYVVFLPTYNSLFAIHIFNERISHTNCISSIT